VRELGLLTAPALPSSSPHSLTAWNTNSRKFVSTILNIPPYRAGAKDFATPSQGETLRHLVTLMDGYASS
jgi:hypothetical protein